jgi:rhodanese-related sulfurtransferase
MGFSRARALRGGVAGWRDLGYPMSHLVASAPVSLAPI